MQPNIKNAAIPSKVENIAYFLIGFVVSVLGNLAFFAERLAGASLYISEDYQDVLDLYIEQLLSFVDSLAVAPASAIFVFWSIIGILSFSILQSVLGVVSEIKEDINITTHYLHPRHYAKASFAIEVLLQSVAHMALYCVGIVTGVLIGTVLAPVSVSLLQSLLLTFTFELGLFYAASLILLWFGIAVIAGCVRLLAIRKQIQL